MEGTGKQVRLKGMLAHRVCHNSWVSSHVWLGSCYIINSVMLLVSVSVWNVEFIFIHSKGCVFVMYVSLTL